MIKISGENKSPSDNDKKGEFGINYACFCLILLFLVIGIRYLIQTIFKLEETPNIVTELILWVGVLSILTILVLNRVDDKSK